MKQYFFHKKLNFLAFFAFSYCTSFAQAKLVISGAKINMVNDVYLSTRDISATAGSLVKVDSSTLKIAGTISSANAMDLINGTVETNGSSAQVIPGNVFLRNEVRNYTVSNDAGVVMQGDVALTDVLRLNVGNLASNGYLTLKSTYTRTARVAPVLSVAASPVSGDVIVERFIPAKRAYRFLTAPLNSTTGIRSNWMEKTNNPSTAVNNDPVPGFGTHITGAIAKGFDATSTQNPSMYTYNSATQQWVPVPDTNFLYTAGNGHRIMIRGNRSTYLNDNNPPASPTTLRAKGLLLTGTLVMTKPNGGGTVGMPPLSAAIDGYSLIGNPYASVLDWDKVEKTDISSTIDIFDPTINGRGGRGAYVQYNSTFLIDNNGSQIDNNLQSGQAFFVRTTGPNPSITFKENHKASANRYVFRTNNVLPRLSIQLQLPAQLNTRQGADGAIVFFSPDYSSDVSFEDSYKLTNQDENIAFLVQGKALSIVGRQPATPADTLPIKVWQLTNTDYNLRINLQNFEGTLQAYLRDRYLNTNTLLSNDIETNIAFSINSDTASASNRRFEIIFKNATTLPVEMSSITAIKKDKGIEVGWITLTESNMDKYVIEKSADGQKFVATDSLKAKQNQGLSSNYSWFDLKPYDDNNYYRIKSVDHSGILKYSSIVKVRITGNDKSVVVVNNPVKGLVIQLQLRNLTKGNYTVTLVNSSGSVVYKTNINYTGGITSQAIKLNSLLSAGLYQIHLTGTTEEHNVSVLFE